MPLLEPGGSGRVEGFLISFLDDDAAAAYDVVCQFEPPKHYRWEEASCENGVLANVLVGESLGRGRAHQLNGGSWTAKKDPVFSFGLDAVRSVAAEHAMARFEGARFDWTRFFRLQMAYLLLWSAIERYTSLLLGPAVDPNQRVTMFGKHEVWRNALAKTTVEPRTVCDVRDPEAAYTLSQTNPKGSILYFYQVRNNLSHRGKAAWADGEIVRLSLCELLSIVDTVLSEGIPPGEDPEAGA